MADLPLTLKIKMSALFLVFAEIHSVTPGIHTLMYFTVTSEIPNIPAYWEVAYLDGIPISHYDSNSKKMNVKQDWVNNIRADEPHYWERETRESIENERISRASIEIAKMRFNQTGGVHMIQAINGCEWNEETGEVDGWDRLSYDGEDFISLDFKTMRWITSSPRALITKHNWDHDEFSQLKKHVIFEICPFLLKKHVVNGRDFLKRTELPKVSLLQKTPSSPITCHATGFYPRVAALFWRKDGEELHEDVEMGETLPNPDETFQMTVHLTADTTDDVEGRYECVFQFSGVKDEIVTKLERSRIQSNARTQDNEKKMMVILTPLVVLILLVVIVGAVVFAKCSRDRQGKYSKPSNSGDSVVSSAPMIKSECDGAAAIHAGTQVLRHL
ncbi:class I histocompatibility antigen, F10 alpha chain-like [Syngnathoides biaculeatus]|uniref:class I histocompatibility antigen, F10 alpha chain-like n=1 Tax=Syngnathoides biaculeatus TaxID=300417 RepID=UPI002ADE60AF|nr:class I histocompatibility antigen, F10 alpha chain-like [Syngnathoides biaculeatus]